MNLSNTLFHNLTNKLQLDTYLFEKEKIYVENLQNRIDYLKKLKEQRYGDHHQSLVVNQLE